jgi:hypothetical protein
MAREPDHEATQGGEFIDIIIVVGIALLGSGVLFAMLSIGSMYIRP